MSDSVLTTVKKCLGIGYDYTAFDTDIILHINAALATLQQLGCPDFSISSGKDTWADYGITNETVLNAVKQFVMLKTRVIFDPPSSSFTLDGLNNQIKELEWRITAAME